MPAGPHAEVRTLEDAGRMVAEYAGALAAKTRELTTLRELFEKTRENLITLQLRVTELRAERHRLADGAMKAEALQRQVEILTRERDELRSQLDARQTWKD